MAVFVQWFSDFADQAIVLPLSAMVALALAMQRCWRVAAAWSGMVLTVLSVMLVLKLWAGACGWEEPALHISSPSGHTASAAMLYGGLFALLGMRFATTMTTAIVATAVAVLFGVSRLILHVHSVPEVLLGGAVGVTGATIFHVVGGPAPKRPFWLLGAAGLAIVVVAHGTRLPAEHQIHLFAAERLQLLVCPRPIR